MAGSYGGVAFMMQAVLFVIVMIVLLGWPSSLYLLHQVRGAPVHLDAALLMPASVAARDWPQHLRLAGVDALGRPRAGADGIAEDW